MPRLVISIDVHNVDPTDLDPHEVADAFFHDDVPTFSPGATFDFGHYRRDVSGILVSAEWAS